MGFNVEFVDIGGGLGVDYDGTRSSNSEGSVNYSIQEYVNDSISTLVDASDKNGIPHPQYHYGERTRFDGASFRTYIRGAGNHQSARMGRR